MSWHTTWSSKILKANFLNKFGVNKQKNITMIVIKTDTPIFGNNNVSLYMELI